MSVNKKTESMYAEEKNWICLRSKGTWQLNVHLHITLSGLF